MTIDINYYVSFGAGDGSETMDTEIELLPEEEAAYRRAVLLRIPLEEVPELKDVLDRAYWQIQEEEEENACDLEDEYAMECEEEGGSPFDTAWDLEVSFASPYEDEEVTEEEAARALEYLFSESSEGPEQAEAYISRLQSDYEFSLDFDLLSLSRRIAWEKKAKDYLKKFPVCSFTLCTPEGEEIRLECPVTEEEQEILEDAAGTEEELEEIDGLEELWEILLEAAREKLGRELTEASVIL